MWVGAQMLLYRVEVNVIHMLVKILKIPNAVICKSAAPYFSVRSELLLGPKRESSLD